MLDHSYSLLALTVHKVFVGPSLFLLLPFRAFRLLLELDREDLT